jgi:hypothetical protein
MLQMARDFVEESWRKEAEINIGQDESTGGLAAGGQVCSETLASREHGRTDDRETGGEGQ